MCENLKIQTPNVCAGIAELYGEVIFDLLQLSPKVICAYIVEDMCDKDSLLEWNVTFPGIPKPDIRELRLPNENMPPLKVLHLSDPHIDPLYETGSNANCGEPLCCRVESGRANNSNDKAGEWGDYRDCDPPKRLFNNLLDHIAATHKVNLKFTTFHQVTN